MKKLLRAMIIAITLVIVLPTAVEARTSTKVTTKISNAKKTVYVGNTFKLSVKRGNSKIRGTKWYSSNKKVATVVKNGKNAGKVTAKSKGKCVISTRYNKKTYKCVVTVKSKKNNSGNKGKWKQTRTLKKTVDILDPWYHFISEGKIKTKTTFSWDVPKNKVITMNSAGKRGGVKEFTFKFACNQEIKKIEFYAFPLTKSGCTLSYYTYDCDDNRSISKYPQLSNDSILEGADFKVDLKRGTVKVKASSLFFPTKCRVGAIITVKRPEKAISANTHYSFDNEISTGDLFTINNNTHGVDWDKKHNYKADGCTWDKAWKEVVIREPKPGVSYCLDDFGIVEWRSVNGNVIRVYSFNTYADETRTTIKTRWGVWTDEIYTDDYNGSNLEYNVMEWKKKHPNFRGLEGKKLGEYAKFVAAWASCEGEGYDDYTRTDIPAEEHKPGVLFGLDDLYSEFGAYSTYFISESCDPVVGSTGLANEHLQYASFWGLNRDRILDDIGGTLEVTDVCVSNGRARAWGCDYKGDASGI